MGLEIDMKEDDVFDERTLFKPNTKRFRWYKFKSVMLNNVILENKLF